ncbi:MAG: dihydroorotase [Clostridiales bacterium]|nr:dihydroorotase [Clostridiales bacterium]
MADVYFYQNGRFTATDDLSVCGGVSFSPLRASDNSQIYIFPGFVDVHVHLREPGFSYKETIAAGTAAAKRAGYAAVCTMPNLDPVPDSLPHLRAQLEIIERDAAIKVIPFGAITVGERGEALSDMESMAPYVCGFSDDGRGVADDGLMREAMLRAKALSKVISAHCEDLSQKGKASEWKQIERDIRLASDTGCAYHVCHISCKESVQIIKDAKKSGVDVTCETAPHYLTLCDKDIKDDGKFKMNPPINSALDRDALVEALADGTVDIVATDHAPHSKEEKSRGFKDSLNGIVGLETAFPVLYTFLVKRGLITLERLIEAMSTVPAKRFSIDISGFAAAYDLAACYVIDSEKFLSKGRSTPFEGMRVYGKSLQ